MWPLAVITGSVIDEHGDPIVGLVVSVFRRTFSGGRLQLEPVDSHVSATDDRGIYRASGLPPGEYVAGLSLRASSTPLSVLDQMRQFRVPHEGGALPPLFGVLLQIGGPMQPPGSEASLRVQAEVVRVQAPIPPPGSDGASFAYPAQFFSGASGPAEAAVLALQPGEQRENVNFTLKPARAVNVAGTLTGARDAIAHVPVFLLRTGAVELNLDHAAAATITDAAGAFRFVGVTPGDYSLRAMRGPDEGVFSVEAIGFAPTGALTITSQEPMPAVPAPTPAPIEFAAAQVVVADRDVIVAALPLRRGFRAHGRLEFAGARARPAGPIISKIGVTLVPAAGRPLQHGEVMAGGMVNGNVTPDLRFETPAVIPGRYVVRVDSVPEGWTLESVMSRGRDLSVGPITIDDNDIDGITVRLTDRRTALDGTVRPSTGAALDDVSVLIFPVDRAGWMDYGMRPRRLRRATVAADGSFTVPDLPPGDYFIVAGGADGFGNALDPAWLARAARVADRVSLSLGERKTVVLTATVIR